MKDRQLLSPRELRDRSGAPDDGELLGSAVILWGPAPAFGTYLRQHREASNLSLRKAALRIGISHTYLALLEQGGSETQVSFEVLDHIADAYGLEPAEVKHQAGYRYRISEKIGKSIREGRRRDFRTLLLTDELRPKNFGPKQVDMFPPAVHQFVIDLVKRADENARNGGPSIKDILERDEEDE